MRLLWGLALAGAAVWSLAAWGAYALVGWVGGMMAANADWVTGHPETVEWLSRFAGFVTGLGLAGVVMGWLAGLALIFAVPAGLRLMDRLGTRRARDPRGPRPVLRPPPDTRR